MVKSSNRRPPSTGMPRSSVSIQGLLKCRRLAPFFITVMMGSQYWFPQWLSAQMLHPSDDPEAITRSMILTGTNGTQENEKYLAEILFSTHVRRPKEDAAVPLGETETPEINNVLERKIGEKETKRQDDHLLQVGRIHDSSNATSTARSTRMQKEAEAEIDPLKVCFVTAEFSDRVEDADILPVVQADMRTFPPRHFCFTNMEDLQAEGWEKIVLVDAELPYKRQITKSRWPKFMGWQHNRLQHCQIIFYGDAYLMNPINETIWLNMARQIKASDVGLMQNKQIGVLPNNGPIRELRRNAKSGKDSVETAKYTIAWLENQTDYNSKKQTPVYKNAQFGYNPSNPRFRNFVTEFWGEYSKEKGSWRDQSYWSYFLSRHGIVPIGFPANGHRSHGKVGKQGHNGHVYVPRNKTVVVVKR
jgi:hypothetical protein